MGINIEEELTKLMKNKDKLLSLLMHEIRTPLTKINGALYILAEENLTLEQKEFCDIAIRGIEEVNTVATNILDVYKNQEIGIKLNKKYNNINVLLKQTIREFKPEFNRKELELSLELPEEAVFVDCDFYKIKQVFNNLLNNALKYTVKGWVVVSAEVMNKSLIITVSDTGSGMAYEEAQNVFNSLYQIDSGVNSTKIGTGLGLELCKIITEAHGGDIWVNSIRNRGSSFNVKLPLRSKNG